MARKSINRFEGLRKEHLELAFDDWLEFNGDVTAFAKSVPGAGAPRTRFILRNHDLAAPLKAIVKKALQISGANPRAKERLFTSDRAESWLKSQNWGYEFVSIASFSENSINQDERREAKFVQTISRPEQARFRKKVLEVYAYTCAISNCRTLAALEAAHIKPKKNNGLDNPSNGILLRADLHRLFDANLLKIDPKSGRISLSPELLDHYEEFVGKKVSLPSEYVELLAFEDRWREVVELHEQ